MGADLQPFFKKKQPNLVLTIIPPIALAMLLWKTSPNDILPIQGLFALLLTCIPWWSYWLWRNRGPGFPLFSLIAFAYWIYFVLPFFWGDRTIANIWNPQQLASDEAVTLTMGMTLLGMAALWTGMKIGLGQRLAPPRVLDVSSDSRRWLYIRLILIAGSLLGWHEASSNLLGSEGRQILIIFQVIVPMVAFSILFRNFLRGNASRFDRFLIGAFLFTRIVAGISSGWLGSFVSVVVTCAVIYVGENKRIPRMPVAFILLYLLFFQVGKASFREVYWEGGEQASRVERLKFWVSESSSEWGSALEQHSGDSMRNLLYMSLSRVSLLNQAANVMELTPAVIPYQGGHLYSYLAATLVPRFLWREKPNISEANQFYQVTYGITPEESLGSVSIAVGVLVESFIAFGWVGVICIMFALGIFLDLFQKILLYENVGDFFRALGVTLLPGLLSVESQMAQYIGGVIQQIVFTIIVFLPILHAARLSEPAGLATTPEEARA